MRIDTTLFKGIINKNLLCSYIFQYEEAGQFQTIRVRQSSQTKVITPCYSIAISEGYDKNRLFIPSTKYASFVCLFHKSVKLVQENIYDIFPKMDQTDMEVDTRALQRFQTEKAMSTAGLTITPSIWVDEGSQTYPGIRCSGSGNVTIPMEDAIALDQVLKNFDPTQFMISMITLMKQL